MINFLIYFLFILFFVMYAKTEVKHFLYLAMFFFVTLIKFIFYPSIDSVFGGFFTIIQIQLLVIAAYCFYNYKNNN